MTRRRLVLVLAGVLALVVAGTALVVGRGGDGDADVAVGGPGKRLATTAGSSTTLAPTTTDLTAPASTTPSASTNPAPATSGQPPTVATTAPGTGPPISPAPTIPPPTVAPAPPPVVARGPAPYRGLGTWVDAFDFDPAHRADGVPTVYPADVDRMAALGIKTLYLQTARSEDPAAPGDLIRPDLLGQFLVRAHARGMAVVAWFLPHHVDVADDMRHLRATLDFRADGHRFDSVALDIEWRSGESDHGARSARLLEVARQVRALSPDRPVGAIVMPPVVTDVLNTSFWPGFPWAELAALVDVFLPMAYWTNRAASSPYRDAYRYVHDNVTLLRGHVGDVPIHAIGGIGDRATHADYDAFRRAVADLGVIGWSSYDFATTAGDAWPHLGGG